MASEDDFDLTEFADVASVLRRGPSDVVAERPPPELWARIEAAVANETAAPDEVTQAPTPSILGGEPVDDDGLPANVTSLASRRRLGRPAAVLVGIAAAIVLLGVPLGLALRSGGADSGLTAELAALPDFAGMGSAQLDDGKLNVVLEEIPAVEPGSHYELWLLDIDEGGLEDTHWVGVIGESDGSFSIPADLDLSEFDVVDISIEPDDGDPSHSGVSVLQGQLAQ